MGFKEIMIFCKGIPKTSLKLIVLCMLSFSSAIGFVSEGSQYEQGIVTLTFDDGYICHYETVSPLLEKYGMSGTFYVTTGLLGQPGYLTTEQVIELSQQGHEIGSHCVTHRNLKKLSSKEVEKELLESKLTLENLIQTPVVHFAPPFGACNANIMHHIKKYYRSSRTIVPDMNVTSGLNPYVIRGHVVLNSTTLIEVIKWLDKAITEKKWLVLVYHHIDDTDGIVSINAEMFEDHLKEIQSRNLQIAPLGVVLKD